MVRENILSMSDKEAIKIEKISDSGRNKIKL
jgi:hypothetical protein